MPDELKSDANIVTKRESVEVITPDGKNLPREGSKNLESIFDKIEGGQTANDAIKETMSNKPSEKQEAAAPAKEDKQDAPQPEPTAKVESKTLDDALAKAEEKNNPLPKVEDGEVAEEDLKVLPQDKPKTARRIQALLVKIGKEAEVRATTEKARDEKAARVLELEAKLAEVKPVDPAAQEEVKQKLEELSQYRRRYELEKDPEVQAKFDGRIKGSEESIVTTLKNHGAGESLLKIIQDEGGWARFADSNKLIPIKGEDEPITAAELAERIRKTLPYSEQRAIDQAVNEAIQAKKDKERYFADESKKANEYFSQREQTQKQQVEQAQAQHTEAKRLSDEFEKKIVEENDWLKEKALPDKATPEQAAQVKEHNEWAKQIQGELKRYRAVKTLPEILGVLGDAVKYHNERHSVAKLTAENKALKATIEQIRSASKVTSRSGSLSAGGPAPDVNSKSKKPASLEEALNRMEDGEKVDE